MKGTILSLACFGTLCGAGYLVQNLDKEIHPPQPPPGLDAHESNAASSLLGQFRTSMSSWLWLRTDLYLHNGVVMRPMTDAEKKRGESSSSAKDDGHGHLYNEGSVTTVIPSAENDFRGVLGDIERATGTYKDMHEHVHNDPKVAMPLFRLMTWVDPQFIPGWTTGANVLARDETEEASRQAFAFLKEGLKENPESVAILSDMGEMSAARFHDLKTATKFLDKACELGVNHFDTLPDVEKEGLNQSLRWLSLCYRDLSMLEQRQKVLDIGLKLYPDDLFLYLARYQAPSIMSKAAQVKWAQEQMNSR